MIDRMAKQHRQTNSRVWWSWVSMMKRCYYPKDKCFPRYGGRGIAVCQSWHDFRNFWADMGNRPVNMCLDRINNDGDYSPENCRWHDQRGQARNRSNNTVFTVRGVTGCIAELAEHFGISQYTASQRIRYGKTPEEAFCLPRRKRLKGGDVKKIILLSKTTPIPEIAKQFGAKSNTIYNLIWRTARHRRSN